MREALKSSLCGRRVVEPGRNCWRVETADRAAVIVDAAPYFACLDSVFRQARRSILIIGWDFDASISLLGHGSERLGDLLRTLVESKPQLEVRVLIWNLSTIHAPSACTPMLFGDMWSNHPRIQVRLDSYHPLYAAQHQKIVVVDDCLAFVGGMDLTIGRWDTGDHLFEDPARRNADGSTYDPVHDVHMAIDGEAARAIGMLARTRWKDAIGEDVQPASETGLWPSRLNPDFEDVPIAISRTSPRWNGKKAIREIALLTLDALRSAERQIYIEAQYLADFRVGDLIAELLERRNGPEIVIVVTRFRDAFVEKTFMGKNRNRLVRRLRRADRYGRLRVYCLAVAGKEGGCGVFVHSKLMIVDDRLLRVGSANLNNRSTGLDNECDVVIEAQNARTAEKIASIRYRLLAEHLGVSEADVSAAERSSGSLIKSIESLNGGPRHLNPVEVERLGPIRPAFGTCLVDPRRAMPLRNLLVYWWRRGIAGRKSEGNRPSLSGEFSSR